MQRTSRCFSSFFFFGISLSLHRLSLPIWTLSNVCNINKLFHLHSVALESSSSKIPSCTIKNPLQLNSVRYCHCMLTASVISFSLLWAPAPVVFALDPLPPIPDALRMGEIPKVVNEPTKLFDGVEYFDVILGDGEEAKEGRSVQFLWVLRRSNGYFVASSASDFANEPFIYRLGNRQKVIPGIDEAIRGMRVGGIRRVSIPPKAAFIGVEDTDPGPLPKEFGPRRQILTRKDREVWKMEIKLLKVK